MAHHAAPSDRRPGDCAFCTCLSPRFDVVTLKTGVRHSEFCCSCGRPGAGDVVSGGAGEEKSSGLVQVPRSMPFEEFAQHVLGEAHKPVWTFFHEAVNTFDFGPILSVPPEAIEQHLRTRVGTPMRTKDTVERVRAVQIEDPAVVVAPYRKAAVHGQRYERTVERQWEKPVPWDAVLSRVGCLSDDEILPEFAPSFVGCLRALLAFRGSLWPIGLADEYPGTMSALLVVEAERDVRAALEHGTVEDRVMVEARAYESLLGYWHRTRASWLRPVFTVTEPIIDSRSTLEWLMSALRGVPSYREAGEPIGKYRGYHVYTARHPANTWSMPNALVVGDDVWVNASTWRELGQAVNEIETERQRWNNRTPLRIIIPTMAAVMALRDDMARECVYPLNLGPYGVLPPVDRPLFDHKTGPRLDLDPELPHDWPRRATANAHWESALPPGGGRRFLVNETAYYVGVDPGITPSEQATVVFMRLDADGSRTLVDCVTSAGGWTEAEIADRLGVLHLEHEVRMAAVAAGEAGEEAIRRARERLKTTLMPYQSALLVERDRLAKEIPKVTGLERPDAAFVPPALELHVHKKPMDRPASMTWSWPGDFGVPGKSTLRPGDLSMPEPMNRADDDALPAQASDTNPSLTFAYAPGERDAYPIGQAPGEVFRWPTSGETLDPRRSR